MGRNDVTNEKEWGNLCLISQLVTNGSIARERLGLRQSPAAFEIVRHPKAAEDCRSPKPDGMTQTEIHSDAHAQNPDRFGLKD